MSKQGTSGQRPRGLDDDGVRFMGRVVAGQSHELVNVLNIVNELSGLQEDVLQRCMQGGMPEAAKLLDICKRVQLQVKRGEQMLKNINRFVHSTDSVWAVFDVREVVARVMYLASRPARLHETQLLPEELPPLQVTIESNPFCLQRAVYGAIELALHTSGQHRRIELGLRAAGDGIEIDVTNADPWAQGAEAEEHLAVLRSLVAELGGRLREPDGATFPGRMTLSVPNRATAGGQGVSAGAPASRPEMVEEE